MADKISGLFSPLLFPPLCTNCHLLLTSRSSLGLCEYCLESLELFNEEQSLVTLPSGSLAACAGPYLGVLSGLIKKLKFYQNLPAADTLAAILRQQNCTRYLLTGADIVIPVPISRRRRLERGFNQCEYILARMEKFCNLHVDYRAMGREHRTAQHTLGREARATNAQGAFIVKKKSAVVGRVVTVFDDVMTTMATAEAMVTAIYDAGAKEVRVVTLGRTV